MTATDIRDYFSDPNIVAEIVRELNMEIGFCPILRNLKREKDCGVIDDESISFRELGPKIGMKCLSISAESLSLFSPVNSQSVTPSM